jgi:uncharacterized membrane protein
LSSIDSPAEVWRERSAKDNLVATVCFGLACAIGLAGAFIGLQTHGFWYDELFTAQLLRPDGTSLLSRIVTDVHPPLYLFLLSAVTSIVGDSDAALRGVSAVSACAAIVVFVAATGQAFSLRARLFGASIATSSLFWFFQSQNARSYALALLVGAGVLALCVYLLDERPRERTRLALAGLAVLTAVGSFVHFYAMYECLAALIVLGLLRRPLRLPLVGIAAALILSSALYVQWVIVPNSQVSLTDNWYSNDPAVYLLVLFACANLTLGVTGVVAVALCATTLIFNRSFTAHRRDRSISALSAFLCGVPIVVLIGAIASSTLIAPSFSARNFLVVSPFLWAAMARLYDVAASAAPTSARRVLNVALSVVVLSMATMVTKRLATDHGLPVPYEPIRESAQWITTLPGCRGQTVPVITTDLHAWYKPGYAAYIYNGGYGRYLEGFAEPQLVFFEDVTAHSLPPDLRAELQHRLDGEGCPVIAWAAHKADPAAMSRVKREFLSWTGRLDAAEIVKIKEFRDVELGLVLYVDANAPASRR